MSLIIPITEVKQMQRLMGKWLNEAVDLGAFPAMMISVKIGAANDAVIKLHLTEGVSKEQVTDFLRQLLSKLDTEKGTIIEP